MSVTVRAAWITAFAMVLSAVVAVIANFYPVRVPDEPSVNSQALSSLLLDLPVGSTVVIKVTKKDAEGLEAYEASIQRTIREESRLKIIESSGIEGSLEDQQGSLSTPVDAATAGALPEIDFLLVFDADSQSVRAVNARSGEIVLASKL
ncbi:MAG: hypothetical protein AAFY29_21065 [Pseudomonadota bacterium]